MGKEKHGHPKGFKGAQLQCNLTGISFPLHMPSLVFSAEFQIPLPCPGALWCWGGGGKVIDLELNFLLGVHDEFGESGHFVL